MTPVPASAIPSRSRELLSDSVRRRILAAILDGTLNAGERLHDDQLIGWLGVSRTPIRTALERLADVGLVEMEPNRFTRVAVPTRGCLAQALQIYCALTISAVEGLVSGFDDVAVAQFRHRLGPLEKLALSAESHYWELEHLQAVDRALSFFTNRSDNPLLLALLREVRVRLAFAFRHNAVVFDAEGVLAFATELLSGVEGRDEAAVTRTLNEHLSARAVAANTTGGGERGDGERGGGRPGGEEPGVGVGGGG